MSAMTYTEWCDYKQRILGNPPAWFADADERRSRYDAYAEAAQSCSTISETEILPSHCGQPDAAPQHAAAPVRRFVPVRAVTIEAVVRFVRIAAMTIVAMFAILATARADTAQGQVTVNGDPLPLENRVAIEALIGPLSPGAYWLKDDGRIGRAGDSEAIANLRVALAKRLAAMRAAALRQQQQLNRQLMMQAWRNAARHKQLKQGYSYGNRFSSGQRYSNGSWSHYNGHSNYGVGGTANGCIYTPNWSNC
jgi:hypothetical protein